MATRFAHGPGETRLPRPFGKYTLLHRIARGGMAELYLALHRSTAGFEKLVVIKRALALFDHEEEFIAMLLHEARIAATLSHPNIVQIYDVGQTEGSYYIAMEHIHGEDLRSIQRGRAASKARSRTCRPSKRSVNRSTLAPTCSRWARRSTSSRRGASSSRGAPISRRSRWSARPTSSCRATCGATTPMSSRASS